ncbi:DUF167 family protein [Patescibacteria group bacterium]|nr:DUF167 family protein [Patescibacteria group bacterium]
MLVKVKVFPNSKQRKILKKQNDSWEIYLKNKPQQNQANQEMLSLLSQHFPGTKVKIKKGGRSQNKIIEIIN